MLSRTAATSASNLLAAPRWSAVDALRGAAMIWMAIFHFNFDLMALGFTQENFYSDVFWTNQRTAILSSFLFCAGMGQALAMGQSWRAFWRRWGEITVCALLVSLSTGYLFGDRWVYFGVLHGIAVMLILTRLLLPLSWALVILGLMLIAWRYWAQDALVAGALPPIWDARALSVLGLNAHKPLTEDFVPLLPWWGVALVGAGVGRIVVKIWGQQPFSLPQWIRPLALLGRWSLSFYMLHQPIFWGFLYLLIYLGIKPH